MNILHKSISKALNHEHNILGFEYILETKRSYYDIICEDQRKGFVIKDIWQTLKKDLNEASEEERIYTLSECYNIVLVSNHITLVKGEKIRFFDGETIKQISGDSFI